MNPSRARAVLVPALAVVLAGGGHAGRTTRVVDDRVLVGRVIDADAYAAFLEGVLAEESGDLSASRRAYDRALASDDQDPEILSRRAEVRCRLGDNAGGIEDVQRALALDGHYAPAFLARARCAAVVRDGRVRDDAEATARRLDPANVTLQTDAAARGEEDGVRAVTLAFEDRAAAWEAMLTWSARRASFDAMCRAAERLAAIAPGRRRELSRWVEELSGVGELDLARRLALSLVLLEGPRVSPLVTRLAVDRAIGTGDTALVRRACVRGHVPLAEAASRAWLLGDAATARGLLALAAAADPDDPGIFAARLVAGDATWRPPSGTVRLGPATWLALTREITLRAGGEAARAFARGVPCEEIEDDPVLVPIAVDLALRGVDVALPPSGEVIRAARAGVEPVGDGSNLGARHRLLFLSLFPRRIAEADLLAARLDGAAGRDAVVTAAMLTRAGRDGAPMTGPWREIGRFVGDPLALGAIAAQARRSGDHDLARRAADALRRVAVTEREREASLSR